jgi:ribosomal protein S18 acetylase RimI-like enzyme
MDEALRGRGHATALLSRVEEIAAAHGAIGSHLMTSTFQAIGFYQKRGYSEIGRLHDRPPGHDRLWMRKQWLSK